MEVIDRTDVLIWRSRHTCCRDIATCHEKSIHVCNICTPDELLWTRRNFYQNVIYLVHVCRKLCLMLDKLSI